MSKLDLGLPGYQSMFESTEKANSEQTETIQDIEIDAISDFKDHPFHINMDEDMIKLIESIEVNGQLMPVLVRPSKNGYEMISTGANTRCKSSVIRKSKRSSKISMMMKQPF